LRVCTLKTKLTRIRSGVYAVLTTQNLSVTTRRSFLTQVGQAGGFGATYLIMQSMGLLPIPPSVASVPRLSTAEGPGKSVLILGAGIAGLVAAWELSKAGYQCVIVEARRRAGGRNWTIRRGTRVEMTDGTTQICTFDEPDYFNAGPARLPSQHRTMLGYCREFEIPLEVEVNTSRSALMQSDHLNGGKPVEQRQLINDTRGHVAELLTKAIRREALDRELSPADKERMLEFLRTYGDLSPDYFYRGSQRSGYQSMPGAGDRNGVARDPLDMHALLDANLWEGILYEEQFSWQATMFQPLGGMDRIPAAFEKRVGQMIRFGCSIEQIRKTQTGVRVAYRDLQTGTTETVEANYCICALPFSVLKKIDADFSPDVKQVINNVTYDGAYKIAWESSRFWEKEYSIYGGISFLDRPVNLVWYPSARLFSEKGVLLAGYSLENGSELEHMDLAAKLEASRQSVEALHPGHSRELKKPVCVCWGRIPYNLGSWIHITSDSALYPGYERIIQPDGSIFFAGDHTSHLVGWQEGAALSAHRAVSLLSQAQSAKSATNSS
jgi:monoamine oxidase